MKYNVVNIIDVELDDKDIAYTEYDDNRGGTYTLGEYKYKLANDLYRDDVLDGIHNVMLVPIKFPYKKRCSRSTSCGWKEGIKIFPTFEDWKFYEAININYEPYSIGIGFLSDITVVVFYNKQKTFAAIETYFNNKQCKLMYEKFLKYINDYPEFKENVN